MSIDTVAELHNHNHPALYGDATRPDILESAGIKEADYLIITLPDAVARLAIVTSARELNPQINILTRARYLAENPHLREAGVTNICFDEVETAAGLAETLLLKMGIPRERIDKEVPQIRAEWSAIVELMGEQEDLRPKG
jgi:CPA2 family monovalent cation:H+ antiporter-2